MEKNDLIYVAGHRGLVGSAICRNLRQHGFERLLLRSHAELDLTDAVAVRRFFEQERPAHVFLAAAKVGGILANDLYPADFIRENLFIQTNVIDASYRAGVDRLLFLGSSCIYPKLCPQPIKEEYLLTGPLEPTNRPYALAKIAGIEMCWSYNRQFHTRYLAAMPANLYGPGDNFDPQNSHVLPALIRKVAEAKALGHKQIVVWGTGTPRRELLFSEDLAEACVFLMNLPQDDLFFLAGGRAADQHRHRHGCDYSRTSGTGLRRPGLQRGVGLRHHKARRNTAETPRRKPHTRSGLATDDDPGRRHSLDLRSRAPPTRSPHHPLGRRPFPRLGG